MEAKIENNELVIRIPMEKPKPSSSGKTLIVASTGGNVQTAIEINGKPAFVGLNAYVKSRVSNVRKCCNPPSHAPPRSAM